VLCLGLSHRLIDVAAVGHFNAWPTQQLITFKRRQKTRKTKGKVPTQHVLRIGDVEGGHAIRDQVQVRSTRMYVCI